MDRRAVADACAAAAAAKPPPTLATPGEAAVASAMAAVLEARWRHAAPGGAVRTLEATSDFLLLGADSVDAAALAAALGGPPATAALILAARTPRGIVRALAGGGSAGVVDAASAVPLPPLLTWPPTATATAGFRVRWRVPLDGCVDASPVVLEGEPAAILATSHGGEAACVDAESGAVRWRARLPGAADEGAAVVSCGVAAVCLAAWPPGNHTGGLAFLDVATGEAVHPPLALNGSPRGPPRPGGAAGGGGVWVGLREGEAVSVGAGAVVSVRVDTHVRLAGAPVPGPGDAWFAAGSATGAAASSGLVRLQNGQAEAWPSGGGGAPVWSGAPFAAPPVVVGGRLVVAADTAGTAAAFDAGSGALAWRAALGGPVAAPPAVVVVGTAALRVFPVRVERALIALDAETGAQAWTARLPGDTAGTGAASTPAVLVGPSPSTPRLVAAASDGGALALLDATTGALLSTARLPAAAYGGPVAVSGSTIVCGCRDDAVWCLEILV